MNVCTHPSKRAKTIPYDAGDIIKRKEKQVIEIKETIIRLAGETYHHLNRVPLEDIRHAVKVIYHLGDRIYEIFDPIELDADVSKMIKNNIAEIVKSNYFENIVLYCELYENDKTIADRLEKKNFVVLKVNGFGKKTTTIDCKIRNQYHRFVISYYHHPTHLRRRVEAALKNHWKAFREQALFEPGHHQFPKELNLKDVFYTPIYNLEKLRSLISEGNFKQLNDFFRYFDKCTYLEEMVFGVNSPYTKEQLADQFLKCVDYPEKLGQILLHYCSLERKEVAEAALKFSFTTIHGVDLHVVLNRWPKLLPKECTEKIALHFIKFGYFWHAQEIIKKGKLNPKVQFTHIGNTLIHPHRKSVTYVGESKCYLCDRSPQRREERGELACLA